MPGRLRAALLVALIVGAASAALAQSSPSTTFQLRPPARALLSRIQVEWLEWLTAANGGDEAAATAAVDGLEAYAAEIGMARLPELSQGAAAKAAEFAAEGNFDRARWALEAAERLDPGRPETFFARATIHDLEGKGWAAFGQRARGFAASFWAPELRFVLLHSLGIWLAAVLLMTALAFVVIEMAVRGHAMLKDLTGFLGRFLPGSVALALGIAALLWPILLPAGLVWLPLFWSVLLWSYAGRLERLLLVGVWVLVGVLPLAVAEQHRQVEVALTPSIRALENAANGRLRGDLFNGLAVVGRAIPASPALAHLTADLHRRLGQIDLARSTYRRVTIAEPANAAALNDLGICYYETGDYERAIDSFERASSLDRESAAAWFNLSQAHSELYHFDESERALRRSRQIDDDRVNLWMRQDRAVRAVAVDGGFGRVREIRREMAAARGRGEAGATTAADIRPYRSLALSLGLLIAAIALSSVRRPGARPPGVPDRWWSGRIDLARRVLLPGVAEAESERWGRAAVAAFVFVAVLALPVVSAIGFRIPWGRDLGAGWLPWLSVVGLVVIFARRLVRQLRES